MSELVNAAKALDKRKDGEEYNARQTWLSPKKTCVEDYLFDEVLSFSIPFFPAQPAAPLSRCGRWVACV